MSDVIEAEETTPDAIPVSELSPDEQMALEVVEEICAASGGKMQAVVRELQPPYISIELIGEDAQAVWSRSGAYLDALQVLANAILVRRVQQEVRIVLDADNYRARRADMLRQRALDIAAEVKSLNQEAVLEALSPLDRRIVHNALSEDPDIRTYSEGQEPERRLIIAPAR